jgi:hypothetical protein
MAHTGENEQALQKIIDFIRLFSIVIMLTHFYFYCHRAFVIWGLTSTITDDILKNVSSTGLFSSIYSSKVFALALLITSLVGAKGKKDDTISLNLALSLAIPGVILFLSGHFVFLVTLNQILICCIYIAITGVGFMLILSGGTLLTRLLKLNLTKDIFNKENESFPQEERLLENEFSINLPAAYILKGQKRQSWINVINPFRSSLVIGTPGAGKSYFVIRHVITQHIRKGFAMFLYDFKYDDLTRIAYNALLKYQTLYKVKPAFYVINFDEICHR